MAKRQRRNSNAPAGQVRLIAGQWRGRKLDVAQNDGLRPTSDRARETLFNWLQPQLPGAHCLDLFAGSGALGFEALSRGAASAVMLEHSPEVVATLRRQQQTLQASCLQITRADALSWLDVANSKQKFDLVFVDPPWHLQCQQRVLAMLITRGWLQANALVYTEMPARNELQIDAQCWLPVKQKTIGAAQLILLRAKNDVISL